MNEEEQFFMPQNPEAEMALLGSILERNLGFDDSADIIQPEHFYDPFHGYIYKIISDTIRAGRTANPVTLRQYLDTAEFEHRGGHRYLIQLVGYSLTTVNNREYAETVFDCYIRRQVVQISEDMRVRALGAETDTSAVQMVEGIERELSDVVTSGTPQRGFVTFDDAIDETLSKMEYAYKNKGTFYGTRTGFPTLDGRLGGGLGDTDLVILAGRPGMGKTALATNIAFNIATADPVEDEDPPGVAFFSMEMSDEQLTQRILGEVSKIPANLIRAGDISGTQFLDVVNARNKIRGARLFIDDTSGIDVHTLSARARRLKRKHNIRLIIIDYLQLIQGSSGKKGDTNRVGELSEITRNLKTLSKDLNVPVVALSQLSRAVENREDKRPYMSDLRESGSIEQDADIVMFVYRDEYYIERDEPKTKRDREDEKSFQKRRGIWVHRGMKAKGMAEVIIGKQRHGPTGKINMRFIPEFTKFEDIPAEQVHTFELPLTDEQIEGIEI